MRALFVWTAFLVGFGVGNLLVLAWPSVRPALERVRELDRLEELWRISPASHHGTPPLPEHPLKWNPLHRP
jgi:hypothetical protein